MKLHYLTACVIAAGAAAAIAVAPTAGLHRPRWVRPALRRLGNNQVPVARQRADQRRAYASSSWLQFSRKTISSSASFDSK